MYIHVSMQSHGNSSKTLNTREDLKFEHDVKLQGKQSIEEEFLLWGKAGIFENKICSPLRTLDLFRKQSTNEKKLDMRRSKKSLTVWKPETSCLSLFSLWNWTKVRLLMGGSFKGVNNILDRKSKQDIYIIHTKVCMYTCIFRGENCRVVTIFALSVSLFSLFTHIKLLLFSLWSDLF